jgi:hypothetical protein
MQIVADEDHEGEGETVQSEALWTGEDAVLLSSSKAGGPKYCVF